MDLEKRIEELEKRVATLEGQVQEQLKSKSEYDRTTQKPKLEKPRLDISFNDSKKFF